MTSLKNPEEDKLAHLFGRAGACYFRWNIRENAVFIDYPSVESGKPVEFYAKYLLEFSCFMEKLCAFLTGTEEFFELETQIILPENSLRARVTATVMAEEDGKPSLLCGCLRRVSEDAKNHEAVTLFQKDPNINVLFDEAHDIVDCNQSAMEYFGFSSRQAFFAGFSRRVNSSLPARQPSGKPSLSLDAVLELAFESGEWEEECEFILDGRSRFLRTALRRVRYGEGQAVFLHMADLTSLRKAREMLAHQESLLKSINAMASNLFTVEPDMFSQALLHSLASVAKAAQATGAGIWECNQHAKGLYCRRIYHWREDGLFFSAPGSAKKLDFSNMPFFVDNVRDATIGNMLVRNMQENERKMFEEEGIRSVLMVPVIQRDSVWGFISFVDTESERVFTPLEELALQSAGTQMVSALLRNEMTSTTQKRLMQQELMTVTSQNFLHSRDAYRMVKQTLITMGSYMGLDGIAIYRHDEFDGLLRNVDQWQGEGKFAPFAAEIPFTVEDRLYQELTAGNMQQLRLRAGELEGYKGLFSDGMNNLLLLPIYHQNMVLWGASVLQYQKRHFDDGDIHLLQFMGNTITSALERQETERKLTQMSAIVENSPQFIVYCNPQGYFNYINDSVCWITGYSREELFEKGIFLLHDEESVRKILQEYFPEIQENQFMVFEMPLRCKNGSERIMSFSAFRANGRSDGYGCIATDITTIRQLEMDNAFQKKREKMLREAAEAAEEASRMKSSFLANMSHEIRTPLNGIIGFAELALDERLPASTRDYLGNINDCAVGLLDIINDILDVSKIESGKGELENVPFSLEGVLQLCESMTSPKAADKAIDLLFEPKLTLPNQVLGDPTKLRQILLNLISNAVKFTEKGAVTVSAVPLPRPESGIVRIHFSVKDTGIGMTDEQLQRIFEPFVQADSSTTRQYGGTGLGLPITKGLLEMMGSRLQVQSVPDAGSIFSFVLDFAETDIRANGRSGEKLDLKPIFQGELLICEDNRTNQMVIQQHLHKIGLDSVIAENGKIGLEMALQRKREGRPFDLILMDIHMPVMDGLEATRLLHGNGITTPIISLSANAMVEDQKIYKQQGMADFLGKPFTAQQLWQCLLRHLQPVDMVPIEEPEPARASSTSSPIDEALGLERAAGDSALYARIQADFLRKHAEDAEQIREKLQSGNAVEARRIAHTLKSVAGLLGAVALQGSAEVVEKAIAGETLQGKQLAALERQLEAALEILREIVPEEEEVCPVIGEPLNRDRALEFLEALHAMLASGDSGAQDRLEEARALLGSLEGYPLLEEQIDDFDFDMAAVTAARLMEVLRKCD